MIKFKYIFHWESYGIVDRSAISVRK